MTKAAIICQYPMLILVLACLLMSCQDEFETITLPPDGQFIAEDAPVVSLIRGVSLRDGSYDNLIDHSSCTSVVLPVEVIVNDQELTISTEDDFDLIEEILEMSVIDIDTVIIVFPIRVILPDHKEIEISSQAELDALAVQCAEWEDMDIECIDFVYPVTVLTYDTNNQLSGSKRIEDDKTLYDFFDNWQDGVLVNFKFPLTLMRHNGTPVEVVSVEALETALEEAVDICDEDDDPRYHNESPEVKAFQTQLVTGDWIITAYFDETDRTSEFDGFTFTFNADGSVIATDGNLTFVGVWEAYEGDGFITLEFEFEPEEDPFIDIQLDWEVVTYDQDHVQLENEDEVEQSIRTLTFGR
jgi:hypothetical protein